MCAKALLILQKFVILKHYTCRMNRLCVYAYTVALDCLVYVAELYELCYNGITLLRNKRRQQPLLAN